MSWLYTALGALVVLIVLLDALWTTLAFQGGGPLAGRAAGWTWRALRRLYRATGWSGWVGISGPAALMAVILTWLGLMWAGWTLVFCGEPEAVINATTREPASLLNRVYFAGYTLVTLGLGDYIAGNQGWQIATVLAAVHGLFELTLAISYLLPVVGSTTDSRALAAGISGLGGNPQEVLTDAWTGHDFGDLGDALQQVTTGLVQHTQAHHIYPIVHYYHSTNPRTAVPLQLATLDEAITLLRVAVAEKAHPPPPTCRVLRKALDNYLRLLSSVYVKPAEAAPPLPDLEPLRRAGIPLRDEAEIRRAYEGLQARRRLVLGLVHHDTWSWDDCVRDDTDVEPDFGSLGGQ